MKVITDSTVTIFKDLEPVLVNKNHPKFDEIRELALQDRIEEALEMMDTRKVVNKALVNTKMSMNENDVVFYKDIPVHPELSKRILDLIDKGHSIKPLEKFLKRLRKNPSFRAITELYTFLQATTLPITPDGYFVAYKKVTKDYKDCHTMTIDNSVGTVVSMPRNLVDEEKDRTCSYGLHFASYDYASNFMTGRLMAIKIDPADVVAIPSDYNNQKGRCCKYLVLEELNADDLKELALYGDEENLSLEDMSDETEKESVEDEYDPDSYDWDED